MKNKESDKTKDGERKQNEDKWRSFQAMLARRGSSVTFDEKKWEHCQLLFAAQENADTELDDPWGKPLYEEPKEPPMWQYDLFTGDTLKLLWKVIKEDPAIGKYVPCGGTSEATNGADDGSADEGAGKQESLTEPLIKKEDQKGEQDGGEAAEAQAQVIGDVRDVAKNVFGDNNILSTLLNFVLSLL